MLRALLTTCLLITAHARTLLKPRELELGWPFGSNNGTTSTSEFAPLLRTFPDQCMLWNSSCSGNRTEALDEFFNNSGTMNQLVYGAWEYYGQHREKSGIPPDMNSKIVSWLRNPDSRSSFFNWHTEHPDQSVWTYTDREGNKDVVQTIDWSSISANTGTSGCCDACELVGGNVDVYFWPMPGANTDCLSTVGTTAASDIDQNLVLSDARGVGGGWWQSQPDPYHITSPNLLSNSALLPNLNARGHALLSGTDNSSMSITVATQNGFTFTFPSIYIGFSSLYAVDRCGAIGTFVPYTMLTFAPEELSTIEWPAWDRGSIPLAATKSFNFADLPCPPSDVMIADQYKPAPGSPYRPVLSPPQQIYKLQSGWSNCVITHAFAGIDPPKPLSPAAALVPNPTSAPSQSHAAETTSVPSFEPVPGASEVGNIGPISSQSPAPAHTVQTAGPRSTPSPSSPSTAVSKPQTPENSLDSEKSQVFKTTSQVEESHASVIPRVTSNSRTYSNTAQKPRFQDRSNDGTFLSKANKDIPNFLDPFRLSRVSSTESSEIRADLTRSDVASNSPTTYAENYEEGVSRPFPGTNLGEDPDQKQVSSDPNPLPSQSSLLPESKDLQGTSITTAEPSSWQLQTQMDGGISTADRKPPDQANRNSERPSSRESADPIVDPVSIPDPAGKPIVEIASETSTHLTQVSSPYNSLPNNSGWPQPKLPSQALSAAGALSFATIPASKSILEASLGLSASAKMMKINSNSQSTSDPFYSASSTILKAASNTTSDSSTDPPVSTSIKSPNTISSSTPPSSLIDPTALNNSQTKPSPNIETAFWNRTAPTSSANNMSTARGPARVSPSSSTPAVQRFKSGDEKIVSFHPMGVFIWLVSLCLAFFLA